MQSSSPSVFAKDACETQLLAWRKSHSFRQNLIKQLLTTETQYVAFLAFVTQEIKQLFQELGLAPSLYSDIFEAIPEFHELHKQILKSFEVIEEQKTKPGFILSAYIDKYIPYLRIYHKYFSTMDKRKGMVNKLKKEGKLLNYTKQLQKLIKRSDVAKRYPLKFLEYIGRIELVDYLNKPFQRYHQYELLLSNYQKLLPSFNIEKEVIGIIIESLKSDITQLNENFSKTGQEMLLDLDKKYGNVLKSSHTYISDVVVGYYSEGRILEGRLHILNGMLLLTQLGDSEKYVKRIILDQNSWFHNLKAGNSNTNSIFVKGANTHQIFVLMEKNQSEFMPLLQKIFDQISFRNSWTKQIMGGDTRQDSFVFKPLSVFLQNNRYVFVVFIKVASAQKGIRNFYYLNELRNIVQYLNETHISSSSKFQKLHDNDEDLGDEEAEHIALGLFEYLIPILKDVRVCQGYIQLQSLLKIVEYMEWIDHKRQQLNNEMTDWLIGFEERLRLKPVASRPLVNVNIWIDSCHKKQVKIGKTERVYQTVQKLIGAGHSFEFTLGIGKSLVSSRIMGDDEILYDCLKDYGQRFEQQANILEKGFNAIFGKQQTNVYLRKYLYIEFHSPAMYIESTEHKLSLLARDYLDRSIPLLHKLQSAKQIELIALLCRAIKFKDVMLDFVSRIYKSSPQYEATKASIFEQISQLDEVPELQCFKTALRKMQYLGVNKCVIECQMNGRSHKLLIGYSFIEIKETLTSDESVLRIDFDELIFSTTPTLLRINTLTDEYEISVNGTCGVQLVLDRHIHIYNIWSKK